jgi:maltose O-acetyltransferase
MLSGEPYQAVDPELTKERLRAKQLLKKLNVDNYTFGKEAALVLKELLPNAHKTLYIEPPFHCDYGYNIHCGERVYFNVNCVVLDVMKVTIGSHVMFGPAVQIYTATHPLSAAERRSKEGGKPVSIGNDCWIGGGAIILPGMKIGNGCVIGAGAVVTKDVPDHSLAAGNPAKVIRKLDQLA